MASPAPETSLYAGSPYETRTEQSVHVPEVDVRAALKSGDVGFLHSFTTGSAVDGPGIRMVAWTTACMFRCQFCHNPDTWTLSNGMPVPLERATEELRKYAHGLKVMKGGFTLSGGEPLMQHRFATRLLQAAKAMGVHTALETNGFYGERLTDEDLANIDLVILDMKAFNPAQHERVTGAPDNAHVLGFARRLAALGRPMWVRYVLVPGLTDAPDEIGRLASFVAGLTNVEWVEILPFHQLGRYKWDLLGLDYRLRDTQPPTIEGVAEASRIFREAGVSVR